MSQPRRSFAEIVDSAPAADVQSIAEQAPARAHVRTASVWRTALAKRGTRALIGLTALAFAGSLAFAPAGTASPGVPAGISARFADGTSRSSDRAPLYAEAPALQSIALYAKKDVEVRAEPNSSSTVLGVIASGTKVSATLVTSDAFRQVPYNGVFGWVLSADMSDKADTGGVTEAPCALGSAVEYRLTPDMIRIYRSVCASFPQITTYGGYRAGDPGFHGYGRALDIMLTPGKDSALGWQITKFLIANASTFHIDHIIFEQKIWQPSNPTWRLMADRGSITANHYDHVHVAVQA